MVGLLLQRRRAEQGVRLVASLPCYLEENVDFQRGHGAYRGSIEALRRLNATGYGARPELPLDLVYNPGGPSLPPGQSGLEGDYRRELRLRHGVEFTRLHILLYTIILFIVTLLTNHFTYWNIVNLAPVVACKYSLHLQCFGFPSECYFLSCAEL